MILIRIFCVTCGLAFGLTEILPLNYSGNGELHFSNLQRQYHTSDVGLSNISHNQELRLPRDYRKRGKFGYQTDNQPPPEAKQRVFRTRERDKDLMHWRGETLNVSNDLSPRKTKKGTAIVVKRVLEIKNNRHRGLCRECPSDKTVVAAKGIKSVLLPEPCPTAPKMWNHHSGPKPGSKIQEGVHVIRGTVGLKKKLCEYSYKVLVNRCEPLKAEDGTTIKCSAENVWGSVCVVSCGKEKEPFGPTETECKEDSTWSHPMPMCKSKTDCSTPKLKQKSNISCQPSNISLVENQYLPSGSTCRFKQNGKEISLSCKDGRWLKSRKNEILGTNHDKKRGNQKPTKNDPCNPNPCKNGGTCLKPGSTKGPFLCKCRPQTQGMHCELRECYYNVCENDGLCIYQNEESTCYCSSEYGGDRCQNYKTM